MHRIPQLALPPAFLLWRYRPLWLPAPRVPVDETVAAVKVAIGAVAVVVVEQLQFGNDVGPDGHEGLEVREDERGQEEEVGESEAGEFFAGGRADVFEVAEPFGEEPGGGRVGGGGGWRGGEGVGEDGGVGEGEAGEDA